MNFILLIAATAIVADSFESGSSTDWTGSAAVTAETYAVEHPFVYPIPTATHARVLRYGGADCDEFRSTRRAVPAGGQVVETMMELRRWKSFDDPELAPLLTNARTALALNADNLPCIYCLQSDDTPGWTPCSTTPLANGTWADVILEFKTSDTGAQVSVTLNGTDLGSYPIRDADDIKAVNFAGNGGADDVVIATAGWGDRQPGYANDAGGLRLAISAAGAVTSLVESATGRELVKEAVGWCREIDANKQLQDPVSLVSDGRGVLTFRFADGGIVNLQASAESWGMKFTLLESSVPTNKTLRVANLNHDLSKYAGYFAGSVSDDELAIFLRDLDPRLEVSAYAARISLDLIAGLDGTGAAFALIAGTRDTALQRVRQMLDETGSLRSHVGGPWAQASDAARSSYMFVGKLATTNADAYIAAACRAGMTYLHIDNWYETLGHYEVRRDRFPGGLDDLIAIAEKAQAAGLKPSIHTLSAAISPKDSWATPVAHSNLMVEAAYTLAAPLTAESTEVLVNEMPIEGHDLVLTYNTKGNVLAVDGELISYTGVRRTAPYGFTGITRGYNQTTVSDHADGRPLNYLRMRFNAFLAEPGSPLLDELAAQIARVYNAMGCTKIYLDGLDGYPGDYRKSLVADAIVSQLSHSQGEPAVESSSPLSHSWPYRVSYQARDTPYYSPNRWAQAMLENHQSVGVMANFLVSQMGWWEPALATVDYRSRFADEAEYYAAHNAAGDAATSILSVTMEDSAPPVNQQRLLGIIGRYERMRLAHAFNDETQAAMSDINNHPRLFQDATGAWALRSGRVDRQRILSSEVGKNWSVPAGPTNLVALRIENLYSLATNSAKSVKILAAVNMSVSNSTYAVSAPTTIASATYTYPNYLSAAGTGGIGFWVTGDGSGAALNVQLVHGSEYGTMQANHVITLDFVGRRYVQLLYRERDLEAAASRNWPNAPSDSDYRTALVPGKLAAVRLMVSDLPAQHVLNLDISDIYAHPLSKREMTGATVTLGAQTVAVPYILAAGDFAELEDGVWTLYDEQGAFKSRADGPQLDLDSGTLDCTFAAAAEPNASERAEVRIFRYGAASAALKPVGSDLSAALAYEADDPRPYAPANGASEIAPLRIRPGERAAVEVTVRGTLAQPTFTVQTDAGSFSWTTNDAPPVLSGVRNWSITSADPSTANATIEVIKHYQTGGVECRWQGGSGAWEDPAHWQNGTVPGSAEDLIDLTAAADATIAISTADTAVGILTNGSGAVLSAGANLTLYHPDAFAGTLSASASNVTFTLVADASTQPTIPTLAAANDPILNLPTAGTTGMVERIVGAGTVTKIGDGVLMVREAPAATIRVQAGALLLADGAEIAQCAFEPRTATLCVPTGARATLAALAMPTNGTLTITGGGTLFLGGADDLTLGRVQTDGVTLIKIGSGKLRMENYRASELREWTISNGTVTVGTQPLTVLETALYHLDATDSANFDFTNSNQVLRWHDARQNGFYGQSLARGSSRLTAKGVEPYPLSPYPTLVKADPVRQSSVRMRNGVYRPAVFFGSVGSDATDSAALSFSSVFTNLRDSFTVIRDYRSWKRGEILGNETSNLANSYYFRGGAYALVNKNYVSKPVREGFISLDGIPVAYTNELDDTSKTGGMTLDAHVVVFSPSGDTYVDAMLQDRNARTGGSWIGEQIGFDRTLPAEEREYLTRHLLHKWLGAPAPVWTNTVATLRLAADAAFAADASTGLCVSNLVGAGAIAGDVAGLAAIHPTGCLQISGTVQFAPTVTIDLADYPAADGSSASAATFGKYPILKASGYFGANGADWHDTEWIVLNHGEVCDNVRLAVHHGILTVILNPQPSMFYIADIR